jgi:hypothetical protein
MGVEEQEAGAESGSGGFRTLASLQLKILPFLGLHFPSAIPIRVDTQFRFQAF